MGTQVRSANTMANVAVPGSNNVWTNVDNVKVDDSTTASVNLPPLGFSYLLDGRNFLFSIPAGANIDGINLRVSRMATAALTIDKTVNLAFGGDKSQDKSLSIRWPSYPILGSQNYGGPTDLWGRSWSPAEINNVNFGVQVGCLNASSSLIGIAYVSFMEISVFFTEAGPGLITSLDCAGADLRGILIEDAPASGVSAIISYEGGDGGPHPGQIVGSTGVTGLTATLDSGNFNFGSGSLTYNISGTPSSEGTASFGINIGGQTCTLNFPVQLGTLLEIKNPVKLINGNFFNCFRGYIPTFFELKRNDAQIDNISFKAIEGINFVKIEIEGNFDEDQKLKIGDSITFGSNQYPAQSATIIEAPIFPGTNNTIVVDILYVEDSVEGFVNYLKNWFVEYRLVGPNTESNKQDDVFNIFNFNFISQSEIDGTVELDISVANSKNKPSLDVNNFDFNNDLFTHFKIQWRDQYLGSSSIWTSPRLTDKGDTPMIVFHASHADDQENGVEEDFQNSIMLKNPLQVRFWNNRLPKINILTSSINGLFFYYLFISQYGIDKRQLVSSSMQLRGGDGIQTVKFDDNIMLDLTVFVKFELLLISGEGEYDDTEYDGTEYKTK